ncbi:hypothetical protein FJ958_27035 [Mesorhizobium sp. B2-3-5]|nr:hypothetical protein FJ958_27035 [Mesorhizobium sp. B2-3-5]
MMPKSVKRFSDDIMLYLFDLETDSDFRSIRPEIIRLGGQACPAACAPCARQGEIPLLMD